MSTIKVQRKEINHFGEEIDIEFPVFLRRDSGTVSKVVPEYYDHDPEKIQFLVEVKVQVGRMPHDDKKIEIVKYGYHKNEGVYGEFDFIRRISDLDEYGASQEEFENNLRKVKDETSKYCDKYEN